MAVGVPASVKKDISDPEALTPLIRKQDALDKKPSRQVCGLPVQLIAGTAYCAGVSPVISPRSSWAINSMRIVVCLMM